MHRIPAIRIHRSKQLAYVRIGGKFHYLGLPGSPESFERYARLVGALDETSAQEPKRPTRPRRTPALAPRFVTVAELAHRYLASTVERFGLRHQESYQAKYAAEALVAEHAALRVTEFGPVAFRCIRSRLVAQGKSRKWVNRLMAAIRRCFKWGIAEELVPPRTAMRSGHWRPKPLSTARRLVSKRSSRAIKLPRKHGCANNWDRALRPV